MTEKVLGFRKKDADFAKVCALCREGVPVDTPENAECESCGNCELGFIKVAIADMNKLVPVVSLAWLEKWIDKEADKIKGSGLVQASVYTIVLTDLLVAVRKEAKEVSSGKQGRVGGKPHNFKQKSWANAWTGLNHFPCLAPRNWQVACLSASEQEGEMNEE